MNVANLIKRSLSYMGRMLNSIYDRTKGRAHNRSGSDYVNAFNTALGSVLLSLEKSKIDKILAEHGGTKILRLSITPEHCPKSPSQFRTITQVSLNGQCALLNCELPCAVESNFDALPFEAGWFDIVILQHTLEYLPNPYGIIKEAARVLKPNGHCVVFAFNPFSLSGALSGIFGRIKEKSIWNRRSLFVFRLQDWLQFVDCTPLVHDYIGHSLPINSPKLSRLNRKIGLFFQAVNMPLSAAQCIVARKDKFNMIRAEGARWREVSVARALFAPSPTATSQTSARNLKS